MTETIKVLIVEDNPLIQAAYKKALSSVGGIEVVATASNGKEGIQFVHSANPDVIICDLNMPVMDGFEFTKIVMEENPKPILIISDLVQKEDEMNIFKVLQLGAVEVLPKPKVGGDISLLAEELGRRVKILSGVVVFKKRKPDDLIAASRPAAFDLNQKFKLLVIGASTGGPQAYLEILKDIPAGFPLPIVCIQHISTGFSESLVDWLKQISKLKVEIVKETISLEKGKIYFPLDDHHLVIDSDHLYVNQDPTIKGHRPSVDVLFKSASKSFQNQVLGVLLTGMGDDGAQGLKEIKDHGGYTIAQDESSSVVYGMPRVASEIGATKEILPLNQITRRILELCHV
ncbi:chemotaxis response regulator protein-glutamate methylesterase [Leptospira kobayashii]|uniref:Protein-glutamate methylesterase/protein-glutamine glutaminase n=1 Tax=Leptospira kobayashii TaxID=1917830 RepID=A0ABM7UK05_9LEPT|nr:chemotaxis-specific protein-glutamate methyltransferase CheB [Leptospira kobayashii]BDA79140.1 chemotaxis response regulator protein-glutamate methylesterase [Leptospira kobayashii]